MNLRTYSLVPAFALVLLCGFGPDRDRDHGIRIPEGSEWKGTRSAKDDKYDMTVRVIKRDGDIVVLRSREDADKDLILDWTFEIKDTSLKLKDLSQLKGEKQRINEWAVGEVRGDDISLDYSWRRVNAKGKGQDVEGKIKLHRQ